MNEVLLNLLSRVATLQFAGNSLSIPTHRVIHWPEIRRSINRITDNPGTKWEASDSKTSDAVQQQRLSAVRVPLDRD